MKEESESRQKVHSSRAEEKRAGNSELEERRL